MDKVTVEKIINDACIRLYNEYRYLIEERAHERDIAVQIRLYLQPIFNKIGYQVNSEYNREGELKKRITKTDIDGVPSLPDLIIHQHGPRGENLVAIQIKGYWNREPREKDEQKLIKLQAKHKYKFLYRLELEFDRAVLTPV